MEEVDPGPPFLLNLSTEVAEKIFSYLTLRDRKSLRLTCKRLYELCNSNRFCRKEKIIWSGNLIHPANMQSDLLHIGRSYYNLVIEGKTLETYSISPFFEKLGAKIHTLVMHNCDFLPGSLESIIMLCEELQSLCVTFENRCWKNPSDFFTLEPFSIARPNITYLSLTLPSKKPYDYFHRMYSLFPKVKKLKINALEGSNSAENVQTTSQEFSSIIDEIMKAGSNLESLELNIPLNNSIIKKTTFFEALPKLKDLSVNFNEKVFSEIEEWYPCGSNLVSIQIFRLEYFRPPELIRLLTNTGLKYLGVYTTHWILDKESFEKLVASQLDTICFGQVTDISGPQKTILDSRLEANRTVKYIYLRTIRECPNSSEALFPKYFLGLVHLHIRYVTDSILQSIFQFQGNLRSLELGLCMLCSINGFCGSEDGGSKYSINNLQQLEHLTINAVLSEIIGSDDFKRAFNLPQLKYLQINSFGAKDINGRRVAGIPTVLYENSTELRALRLEDSAMPSRETLASLFKNLKHLNYLRCDLNNSSNTTQSVTFINTNCEYFSISAKTYKYAYSIGEAYYDMELDRMVILNAGLGESFYFPKIGSYRIDWIDS